LEGASNALVCRPRCIKCPVLFREASDVRQHERVVNRSKCGMGLFFVLLRLLARVFAIAFFLTGSGGRAADWIGEAAPPLALAKTFQGPDASAVNWEALKGKVVVLDFWATWCAPCIASIPHWNELALQFKEKPVVFLAITDENEAVVSTFLKKTLIRSWIGIDGVGRPTREVFGVNGIPTTFIVNQVGVVAAITHPAKLQPRDIDEVIETGRSSLPPPDQRITAIEPELEMVSPKGPLLELSVRRSGPRPDGGAFNSWEGSSNNISGKYSPVKSAIIELFGGRETLLDCRTSLPTEDYDFIFRLRTGESEVREAALA
jgi:thiol-disulfide isomerase/thioredoxin